MFYVENVTTSEKIWGGQIYAVTQKRLINDSDLSAYQKDNSFLSAVLGAQAKVYTDENFPIDPENAVEYINGEEHMSQDGVPMVRITTVPDDMMQKMKGISFTTGMDTLNQDWWLNDQGMECYLEFKKLNPSTGLLEYCDAAIAEFTILVWMPTYQTMLSKICVDLAAANPNIKMWAGYNLLDIEELGRLCGNVSFAIKNHWEMYFICQKQVPAPLRWYVQHPVGTHVAIEVELYYHTNLVYL